jgi:hypothetical protein
MLSVEEHEHLASKVGMRSYDKLAVASCKAHEFNVVGYVFSEGEGLRKYAKYVPFKWQMQAETPGMG